MATEERDSTADWIVPAERRPPSAFELQRRIDVATAVARAAEEAAMEIGQASLEAAEQARRAAAHAERSAAASVEAARAVGGFARSGEAEGSATSEELTTSAAPEESAHPTNPEELRAHEEPGAIEEPATPEEPGAPDGHELIPGSELPVAWSPVAPGPTAGTLRPVRAGADRTSAPQRPARPTAQPDPFDERMIAFRERAERVTARLRALERSA